MTAETRNVEPNIGVKDPLTHLVTARLCWVIGGTIKVQEKICLPADQRVLFILAENRTKARGCCKVKGRQIYRLSLNVRVRARSATEFPAY